MTNNVVPHPKQNAKRERAITRSPEAAKLQDAIFAASSAYGDFLERNGLIFDDTPDCEWCDGRPKSLVFRWEFCQGGIMTLDGGAEHPEPSHRDEFFDDWERRDGKNVVVSLNPDPDGRNPPAPRTPASRRRRHDLDPLDPA